MIVKVCGMREAENIRAVAELGIDLMGFIFWPESPRYVQMISSRAGIIPDYSSERLEALRASGESVPATTHAEPRRVGVFVDDMPQNIVTRVYNYNLDYVQLHGKESRVMIENLRRTLDPDIRPGVKIIKAISVKSKEDLQQCREYEGVVDLFLFDTKTPLHGGSGEQFDWQVLSSYDGATPFLLSGGVGPNDVERIRNFRHPLFAGIDLNSRFESAPGVKDVELLRKFLAEFRMNKINQLFAEQQQSGRKLLSLYFCAGSPTLEGTADVILTLQRRGIDMIEVGMPFSDPLADGPVIQTAGTEALRNGMTTDLLFSQLEQIKDQVTIPLVWMGYLNIVMHYGFEAFFQRCVEVGISGIIIPDLPFQDYLDIVKPLADRFDLRVIMMITPETSEERIRFIDRHTDGFIYMVSSASITGAQSQFGDAKIDYFRRIDQMQLRNPRMIGFGISNRQTLESAQQYAAGAIIGSKFVTLLRETGSADEAINQLFSALQQ